MWHIFIYLSYCKNTLLSIYWLLMVYLTFTHLRLQLHLISRIYMVKYAISRCKYGTFIFEFLHIGAVEMLDIKYTCSLRCVEVRLITHSQELLSKAFLHYVKYNYKYIIVEFLNIGTVKMLDIMYSWSLRCVKVKYTISSQEI